MSIFVTSDDQKVRVYEIAAQMKKIGLSSRFISACVEQALDYEGTHDLMVLWAEAQDEVERNEIIADLQDEIDFRSEAPKKPLKKPYIKFDDLKAIALDVMKYKNALRKIVDRHGGIAKLAESSGIPQPSLSRFFNSASMPRRATLYKIAEALNLSEKEIIREWVA
jgi:lambda repressor-like predicted transcriptional regulator